MFCRACGKQIEADARFCRFCGKSQAEGPAAGSAGPGAKAATGSGSKTQLDDMLGGMGLERWLRRVFPRHHLQDEITHFVTIAAIVIGVVGFLLALRRGAITPAGERRPTGGMRRRSPPQRNSRPLGSRLWSSAELGGGRFGRLLWRLGHLPLDLVFVFTHGCTSQ